MLLKFPYVRYYKAGDCMVEQTAKRKVLFFFSFLVGRISLHCPEHSNEIKFKKTMRRKKKKREIQINKEPKLRIKSEITVIIFAVDKGKTRL